MSLGTFDDRTHASNSVKHWLSRQEPAAYSVTQVTRLAREIVKGDRDGVDHLEVKWRETSYGIIRGIVEFGVEEVERLLHRTSDDRSLGMALAALQRSLALLPGNAPNAANHIVNAVANIERAELPKETAEKPVAALRVALALLGMAARPVPVAA